MKKIIGIITILAFVMVSSVQAQHWQTIGIGLNTQDAGADSATFSRAYYIRIPDGVEIDTSMQLVYWQNSSDGTPVIVISYTYGIYFGGALSNSVMSANTTTIDANYEVEGMSAWEIPPHADDDCENDATVNKAFNMLRVTIAGYAANRADTQYKFLVAGIPLYENTKLKTLKPKI